MYLLPVLTVEREHPAEPNAALLTCAALQCMVAPHAPLA